MLRKSFRRLIASGRRRRYQCVAMEARLARLTRSIHEHRVLVAFLWLIVLVLASPLAAKQTDRLSGGGWDVPGSQSAKALALLEQTPGHEGERVAVFVEGSSPRAAI